MGQVRHNGGRAGAGAAAHTGGDENHIGSLQNLGDPGPALFGGLLADLRLGAGAHTAGQLLADLELIGAFGLVEILLVRVDDDKFHAAHTGLNHAVDNIVARAAYADDLNIYNLIRIRLNGRTRHILLSSYVIFCIHAPCGAETEHTYTRLFYRETPIWSIEIPIFSPKFFISPRIFQFTRA